MIPILSGNVASALPSGYNVANSCRFDGSSSFLTREFDAETSADKWTFSCWFKRSSVNASRNDQIYHLYVDGNNHQKLYFESDDQLRADLEIGASLKNRQVTTPKYRDPAAWMHVVIIYDSGNATSGNRQRMFINGTEITAFGTDTMTSQDQDSLFVDGNDLYIGKDGRDYAGNYFDGYMAEVVFCDGQAYTPSSFGEFDEDSPTIWKPKDVSGLTFGNNGFYLDFEDSSALGNDVSGNNNDFTTGGLAATDQSTDTPTNNFATLNFLDNYYASGTFSEGNLKIVTGGSNITYVTSTIGFSSGKFYMETKLAGSSGYTIGVVKGVSEGNDNDNKLGNRSDGWSYDDGGDVENNGSTLSGSFDSYSSGDIIGVYADLDNNKLYFSKNGTLQNSGTGLALTSGTYFFAVGDNHASNSSTFEVNFGSPTFSITSGNTDGEYGNFEYSTTITGDSASKTFKALNTKNLAEFG